MIRLKANPLDHVAIHNQKIFNSNCTEAVLSRRLGLAKTRQDQPRLVLVFGKTFIQDSRQDKT
jgi:hypothetical protein